MSGRVVETKKGLVGVVKNNDLDHQGKVKVFIVEDKETLKPKLGSNGEQLKMLCIPETLKVIGFYSKRDE